MAIDENKQKALAAALGQIEKQFGKGSIMRLGEDRSMDVETISTGSLSLDIALGAGVQLNRRNIQLHHPHILHDQRINAGFIQVGYQALRRLQTWAAGSSW